MRFFLVIGVWIVLVGGVYLYTVRRDQASPPRPAATHIAPLKDRSVTLEFTPTFNLEKDPFALTTEETQSLLEMRVNGSRLPVAVETSQPGKPIRVEVGEHLVQGPNELFVQASPPTAEGEREYGIRIKILEGASLLAEKTVWGAPGGLVSGTLLFTLADKEDAHDH